MSLSLETLQRLRRQAGHAAAPEPVARIAESVLEPEPIAALRRMLGIRERARPVLPVPARDRHLPGTEILPLFARQSAQEQARVFSVCLPSSRSSRPVAGSNTTFSSTVPKRLQALEWIVRRKARCPPSASMTTASAPTTS